MQKHIHNVFMQKAILEAKKATIKNEIPVGAIITKKNKIIARGYNQVIKTHDATSHAEIISLRQACKKLKNYRLLNCSIYITLEPCLMCLGALLNARIKYIYFGTSKTSINYIHSKKLLKMLSFVNYNVQIKSGFLKKDCSEVIKNFFKHKRKN